VLAKSIKIARSLPWISELSQLLHLVNAMTFLETNKHPKKTELEELGQQA
jgi:hypothetical protein